jgi:hypothetical protein
MPPEATELANDADNLAPWKVKAAAVWIGLVTLCYIGTIVAERGERIHRIVSSFLSN